MPLTGAAGQAAIWAARADELALWAQARLVNRLDAWGAYTPPERRGREYVRRDGTTAKVPVNYTAKGRLTPGLLARHFRGARHEHIIGLHTTSPDNSCRWGAVDIDRHGDSGNDPAANLAAAVAWHDRLRGLGLSPLLSDSNGAGGFHLLTVFREPVPTARVFALMRWLVADYSAHGLTAPPECFPKQPHLPPGGYGNWLRLPGRHHTREHWSAVWDGARWLSGADAVAYLLTFRGDPPALVPPEAAAPPPPPPRRSYPSPSPIAAGNPNLSRRVAGYMARLPHLGEGQGRDDVAFSFACWLVRDMQLADDVALQWLRLWDAGNRPPKGEDALRKVVAGAHAYGRAAYGCGRDRQAPRLRRGHLYFSVEI
jgi:hypothetical protein